MMACPSAFDATSMIGPVEEEPVKRRRFRCADPSGPNSVQITACALPAAATCGIVCCAAVDDSEFPVDTATGSMLVDTPARYASVTTTVCAAIFAIVVP